MGGFGADVVHFRRSMLTEFALEAEAPLLDLGVGSCGFMARTWKDCRLFRLMVVGSR